VCDVIFKCYRKRIRAHGSECAITFMNTLIVDLKYQYPHINMHNIIYIMCLCVCVRERVCVCVRESINIIYVTDIISVPAFSTFKGVGDRDYQDQQLA
jgi:hypothetical protein